MQTELNYPTEDDTVSESQLIAIWAMEHHLLNWDGIAINGIAKIAYRRHWGDEAVLTVVTNPTYRDLLFVANELIVRSGDRHHIFIENFIFDSDNNEWQLMTGS